MRPSSQSAPVNLSHIFNIYRDTTLFSYRFYSKFHKKRMEEFTDIGLQNFTCLFLVLASCVDTENMVGSFNCLLNVTVMIWGTLIKKFVYLHSVAYHRLGYLSLIVMGPRSKGPLKVPPNYRKIHHFCILLLLLKDSHH